MCIGCHSQFPSSHTLSTHQAKLSYCNEHITDLQNLKLINPPTNQTIAHTKKGKNLLTKNIESDEEEQHCNDQFNDEIEDSITINSGKSISNNTFHYSNEIVHELKLLRILTDIGAPLYAYKTLMEWAHEAKMSKFNFDTSHKTYQQTIKYLEDDLHFHILQPKYVLVTLLPDNLTLQVVVFDIKMLSSLFQT
jgi:hypothetical protein